MWASRPRGARGEDPAGSRVQQHPLPWPRSFPSFKASSGQGQAFLTARQVPLPSSPASLVHVQGPRDDPGPPAEPRTLSLLRSTAQPPCCSCARTPLPLTGHGHGPGDEGTSRRGVALPTSRLCLLTPWETPPPPGGAGVGAGDHSGAGRGGKRWPLWQGSGTWLGGRDVDRLQRHSGRR